VFMLFLSQLHPFRAGNVMFPIQALAERQRAGLTFNPIRHAYFELSLLERRIDDLQVQTGTRREFPALRAVDLALDRAAATLTRVSPASAAYSDLHIRMLLMVQKLQAALPRLQVAPLENATAFQTLQAKTTTLALTLDINVQTQESLMEVVDTLPTPDTDPQPSPTPTAPTTLPPQGIPFPPGSEGAEHLFYPFTGGHAVIECAACHPAEQSAGTPTACVACHQNVLPTNHFTGDCATCHTPASWQDATFDHALYGATDCLACHTVDKPVNHYAGQCSACHTTTNWADASFDHTGQTSCSSCHTPPANHYAGECSNCHSTNN
jgi:hypothetical protein